MVQISELIKTIIDYINYISGGNQMIGGAISLALMGGTTYLLRSVPMNLWKFFVKHTTTELVTTSQNIVFHNLLKWIQDKGYAGKFRKIKLSNGRWGYEESLTKSVGYGTHIIWYKFRPILITLNKEESKSDVDKETIILKKLGRSHKIFDCLIRQISDRKEDINSTSIHKMREKSWHFIAKQPKRELESVIIEPQKIESLKRSIKEFLDKEQWYIKHGIPWQLGILLYGPPGTGKTSLIKALAAYTDRSISLISASYADSISVALQEVPENTITVIEDVDACGETHNRRENLSKDKNDNLSGNDSLTNNEELILDKKMERLMDRYGNVGLADLLNAIDGVISTHGRILIMTTNHRDKLDQALLRPGRVDIQIEVGFITMELLELFICRFYPEVNEQLFHNRSLISNKLSGADLQNDILEGLDAQQIINKRTIENKET